MAMVLHKANTRWHEYHGWLESWHTFHAGNYYDQTREAFGALRVLNHDILAPRTGFRKHAHQNMEIITIPLKGELEHEDDTGTRRHIKKGDVQLMSAGSGIAHSEKNPHHDQFAELLQIWILPRTADTLPRYRQEKFTGQDFRNRLHTIIAPVGSGESRLEILQQAWLSMGRLDRGLRIDYQLKKEDHGVYAFLIEGDLTLNEIAINARDGLGITDSGRLSISADSDAELLLIEVPVREV